MPIASVGAVPNSAPADIVAGEQVRSLAGGMLSGELLDAYGMLLASSRSVSVVLRAVSPSGCAIRCSTADGCLPDGSFVCTAASGLQTGLILVSANANKGLIEIPGPNLTLAGVYTLALQASVTTSLTLSNFHVFPAAAAALVLPRCPPSTMLEVVIAPAPLAALVDRFGNIIWPDNTSIMTVRAADAEGYSLLGLSRTRVQNGVATFWNIAARLAVGAASAGGGAAPALVLNFSASVGNRLLSVLSSPLVAQSGACTK
jgi:hypothetical protein